MRMNFSARVKIEGEDGENVTPTLEVEAVAPRAGMDDDQIRAFMRKDIPTLVNSAFERLPQNAVADARTDVWLTETADGLELHSRAYFGDQDFAHGSESVAFLRTRIIEVMQVDDNWHRKPAGKWTFKRQFSLEDWTPPAPELKPITKDEIEKIVSEGVSAMYKAIQDKIGQTDGGVAGIHHSGNKIEAQLVEFFVEYVRLEKKMATK